ncbi:LacI family DNA-binding transcriptional regulator [Arthrobacter sp. B10-11]|uniref:LacI family DNA-binding transcriptional regulator n=1 Tax=Arthrobacter sp. B10-11 TaxID=3081160 RepID=UPI002953F722|nr:LacI family DNA-binding transcriptional regulator [Arthrobacter sp. B10-11]MDV8147461.1 LacI family DNA-binding transcriptional regulator [Arthrobacter sp. B10-11]
MPKPRPSSGPTMHDVAAAAGVSQATVSLVLNSVSGSRFSDETRKRVMDAVQQLGYRTNAHAKTLRDGIAGIIGFLGDAVATAPFAGKIIEGAQERAWEDGLLLLTMNTGGDKALEAASLDSMLSYKVAGVVYAGMYHRRLDVPEALQAVPSVVLNSQDRKLRIPSVAPNEELGGYTATRRLLDAGHERVAMINIETLESELPAAVGRFSGYTKAMTEAGLPARPELARFGSGNELDGFTHTMDLMTGDNPPSAIFCANDRTAWGAYQAATELHLSIPRDVSIIGFDNQETLAPHLRPGLTTLELPFVEMGRRAVDLILQGAEPDGRVEFMTCPLIERNSVTHPKEKP